MKKKKWTKKEINYLLSHQPKKSGDYEKIATKLKRSAESVRGKCRQLKLPNVLINVQSNRNQVSLEERLLKVIKNKAMSIIQLANYFDVSPNTIKDAVQKLREQKIMVDAFDDTIQLAKEIEPTKEPFKIDFKKHKEIITPIGFIADQHIGSKYERLDVLESLYDRFKAEGVENVYQGGNIIDGECRFNKYDIYVHGVSDQVKNLVKKFPQRKGIKTHFITGDDHEGWYTQREHINIGEYIEDVAHREGRDDLIHLGYMERDLEFKQSGGKSIIRVIHAGGGSSYAHSYTAQKYVEALQGGEKPSIILVGHYHKFNWAYPREVHVIQGGCTEDQTPFMRKRKLQAMVGGVILWIRQNDLGIFTSVKVEWFPYYDKKFYAYKW